MSTWSVVKQKVVDTDALYLRSLRRLAQCHADSSTPAATGALREPLAILHWQEKLLPRWMFQDFRVIWDLLIHGGQSQIMRYHHVTTDGRDVDMCSCFVFHNWSCGSELVIASTGNHTTTHDRSIVYGQILISHGCVNNPVSKTKANAAKHRHK